MPGIGSEIRGPAARIHANLGEFPVSSLQFRLSGAEERSRKAGPTAIWSRVAETVPQHLAIVRKFLRFRGVLAAGPERIGSAEGEFQAVEALRLAFPSVGNCGGPGSRSTQRAARSLVASSHLKMQEA